MSTRVRNDLFSASNTLDRGRPFLVEACWYVFKCCFFLSAVPWPSKLKCLLLRVFGGKAGIGVNIKPRVNIHQPWRLAIGDHTWLGEEVSILNLEYVSIGAHCCISQRAFICTGNHDYTRMEMPYRNAAIAIQDGVWVGAQSFVGPGVELGTDSVIAAGSVVTTDVPEGMVCGGNPCEPRRRRWQTEPPSHGI